MLAWGDEGAAEREHIAEQLTLTLNQLMRAIDFHRRVVAERRAFLAVIFPAFAAVGKGAASGHAPVVVQRPDESGIRLMRLHLATKRHHLFQIQPVAVQHVKVQHNRAASAGDGAVEIIQVAEQVAVEQAEQRDIGDGGQTWRLLQHLRIVIMADAFLATFAVTVNEARL